MASSAAPFAKVFETRPYADNDWASLADLFEAAYGHDAPMGQYEVWAWKHRSNPFGHSYLRVATQEDGTLIGVRTFMRWRFRAGDRDVRAVRAVDTATHPDYQRLGVFSRLTAEGVHAITAEGTDTVFNTPNSKSLPGYLKLGWRPIGSIKPLVRVLNYPRFLFRVGKALLRKVDDREDLNRQFSLASIQEVRNVVSDDRFPELLRRDAALWRDMIRTDKTQEYVSWRYASHPTVQYHALTIGDQAALHACAIIRTNIRRGLREVVLSELFIAREDKNAVKRLCDTLAQLTNADYLVAYFLRQSVHQQALRSCGFYQLPIRALELVANPRSKWAGRRNFLEPDRWAMSLGDLELL